MQSPTCLYKDGKSIIVDASEVPGRMEEGWRDNPNGPVVDVVFNPEPATEPEPRPVHRAPVPDPDPGVPNEPAPVSEQPQAAPDVPGDPNVSVAP